MKLNKGIIELLDDIDERLNQSIGKFYYSNNYYPECLVITSAKVRKLRFKLIDS